MYRTDSFDSSETPHSRAVFIIFLLRLTNSGAKLMCNSASAFTGKKGKKRGYEVCVGFNEMSIEPLA